MSTSEIRVAIHEFIFTNLGYETIFCFATFDLSKTREILFVTRPFVSRTAEIIDYLWNQK